MKLLFNRRSNLGHASSNSEHALSNFDSQLQNDPLPSESPVLSSGQSSADEKDAPVALETSLPDTAIPEQTYPTGLKLAGIISGLSCAIFLVALDQTIIATASESI